MIRLAHGPRMIRDCRFRKSRRESAGAAAALQRHMHHAEKGGYEESVATVANTRPPITARPSGAFCSPPSPSPSAIGSMPMIIASAVISTGRKRVKPASSAAPTRPRLPAICSLRKADHQDRVRRGHAHAHDGARQRRHTDVRLSQNSIHTIPRCRRQSGNNDERIEPRLEVHHDQRVHRRSRTSARTGRGTRTAWSAPGREL